MNLIQTAKFRGHRYGKQIFIILIMIATVGIFVSCSANSSNETVFIDNEEYELCDSSWTPFGTTRDNGDYLLYETDFEAVFAKSKDDALFEGVIYHNTKNTYPNLSTTNQIDKIVLEADGNKLVLDKDTAKRLTAELLGKEKAGEKTATADISTADVYVNIYYKNYPAYQNEYMLCCSKSGELGFMYCETARNSKEFGQGNMRCFSDRSLVTAMEALGIIQHEKNQNN